MRLPLPARYWVIRPEPLKMSAGLFRLGQDFGNGDADGQFFQRDLQADAYAQEKARVLATHPKRFCQLDDPRSNELGARALAWMLDTLEREQGPNFLTGREGFGPTDLLGLSRLIQEDFALLQRDPSGADRLVLLSVCFPSGWRPETLLGRDFAQVHAPVPEFDAILQKRQQLVRGMVGRGPYVRFVWTVSADGRLDHHPDHAPRDDWREESPGYVRVERQVTVPFPEERGSLFLIRTYLYPFSELSARERSDLRLALEALPEPIARYKGLLPFLPLIVRRLDKMTDPDSDRA